jgi:hypothetical protein
VCSGGAGALLEHGAGKLPDLGWQGTLLGVLVLVHALDTDACVTSLNPRHVFSCPPVAISADFH